MKTRKILFSLCLVIFGLFTQAQNGLENIYVERYYVTDATDSAYSHPSLPIGSVTYRIYADLLPDYEVQTIFGSAEHSLLMNTTTYFFNNEDYGNYHPTFSATNAKKNTVMIDSWLTTGGACNGWNGILKTEDNGLNNFVNSNVPQLLQNNNPALMGIPLTTQDGMFAGTVPPTITLGIPQEMLDIFGDGSANGNTFLLTNGAWSCLAGAKGPDPITNKVLIAQITTDGVFHFELNIQIGTPSGGTENYVWSNPTGVELTIPSLVQTLYPVPSAPSVTITSPADGSIFPVGSPVPISADANDTDGTVTQVEFFVDNISIAIDASAPFETTYTGIIEAAHVLTATATDNEGQSTTSAPVNFYIAPLSRTVTFNLDMSTESVSPDGVHISGSFNNWNPSATPMTAGLNNIYSVTLPLTEGEEYMYRFVNGNTNAGLEFVPAACGVPNGSGLFNRFVVIPSNDTIIDTVCYSMCTQCPVDIPVIFNVDMTYQTVSPDGVYLAGTFNGWNTSATAMTAGANNIYSVSLMLTPGTFHQYKFVNGNDPSGYETVPYECGSPSGSGGYDRYITIPVADTSLIPVCFSSCVECGGTAQYVNVTFKVDMHHEIVSPNGVHIAGSFQGWQPGATPMSTTGDTVYTYTQSFLSGSNVEYKFVNGNSSGDFEVVPAACSVNGNRQFIIPTADTVLNLVCFSSCEACPPVSYVNVTFRVDMSLSSVSSKGIHLIGSFQGWDPASTVMEGTGNIYSVTMQIPSNTNHEYKFVNGNTLSEAEIVPSECSQNGNRYFMSANDTILPLVCYAKCVICDVGLSADMSMETAIDIYPNPFNESAQIFINLPDPGFVKVQVFNHIGQLVSTIAQDDYIAGSHNLEIKGNNMTPGFYYCTIHYKSKSTDFVKTLKIIRK